MEQSNAPWLSNLDSSIIDHWELGSLEQLIAQNTWDHVPNSFGTADLPTKHRRPCKLAKSDGSWDSSCTEDNKPNLKAHRASSQTILSFGDQDSHSNDHSQLFDSIVNGVVKKEAGTRAYNPTGTKRSYRAAMATPGEHVIAERKRREKLTQKFIALSAIIPNLKKMDKASVLGDAINYMKQLQEQVKNLEDQAAKKAARKSSSAILVKKSQILVADEDNSSCDENFEDQLTSDDNVPDIEARISENSVLVKIHCENRKGVLVKVLSEIENLHLVVGNTSAVPFASAWLHITVTAQIEEGFSMTANDIVKNLNSVLRKLI